ncbi:MAG: hypothetical protein JXB38_15445 [Anaerolineales bacterium]|nr:hypothetical protein [Anaerolineales bacterium]
MKKKRMIVGVLFALTLLGIPGIAFSSGVGDWFLLTDDPGWQSKPAVAYNSQSNQFLVAWEDDRGTGGIGGEIYAQLVNSDGTLTGVNFPVVTVADPYEHRPISARLAYNSTTNRYMTIWWDSEVTEVYGQQVNANGTLFGSQIAIPHTTVDQGHPDVVYNPAANQFLVVYDDYHDNADVYGAFVNADGTFPGPAFSISTAAYNQLYPAVAYGATDNRYLVVWWDGYSTSGDIYGRFVNADATMAGDEFAISFLGADKNYPVSVAYAPALDEFLVVWGNNDDVYGRLVKADQSFVGLEFQIASGGADYLEDPAVSFDTGSNRFLVTWRNSSGWGSIDARLVGANGEMPEPSFEVAGGIKRGYYYPDVAFGAQENRFLLVWERYACLNPDCSLADLNIYGALYQPGAYNLYLPLVLNN